MNVRPFPAVRPAPAQAAAVAAVPYDVVDTAEARALAAGNPVSFLHVSRPEIDMPDGTRQFHANKLEGTVDKFAQEFKVKAEECMMDFTMTLNPTDEEEIAAQRDAGPIVA